MTVHVLKGRLEIISRDVLGRCLAGYLYVGDPRERIVKFYLNIILEGTNYKIE